MLVMKFGGTSVGDARCFTTVRDIVARAVHDPKRHIDGVSPVVVVVSAMSTVTETLLEAARLAAAGNERGVAEKLQYLRQKHWQVVEELFSGQDRNSVRKTVEGMLGEFQNVCAGMTLLRELPLRAMDAGLSVGERLSAALLASPWFPRNIEYLLFHILFKTAAPLHGEQLSSLIGTEWYPPGWRNVLMQSWPAHLMLGAAIASQLWRRTFRPDTVLAAGVALLSLALYFGAVRFAEYYIPFSALAAGLAARDFSPARGMRIALVAWTVLAASVGLTQAARVALAPPDHLAKIGERLNQLGRPGEVVFNSSWSDFMALVWWAGGFRYINGLDGHYLAYADPARFAVWLALGSGQMDDPAGAIEAAFGARFAVVARQHERLARQLLASPRAALRVDSPEGWLFEIAPAGKPIPPAR